MMKVYALVIFAVLLSSLLAEALAWDAGNYYSGSYIDSSPDDQLKSKVWTRNNVNLLDTGEIVNNASVEVMWQWTDSTGKWAYPQCQPVIADIDQDGTIEIVYVAWTGTNSSRKIFCFNGETGEREWASASITSLSYRRLTGFDIDLDGYTEILVSGSSLGSYQGLYCFNHNGTQRWRYSGDSCYEVACYDLDSDSKIEIIMAGEDTIYSLNSTGSVEWSKSVTQSMGILVGDVDNDASPEVVTQTYSSGSPNYIRILSNTGSSERNITISSGTVYLLAMQDTDGDDNMEILYYSRMDDTTNNIGLVDAADGSTEWTHSTEATLDSWQAAMYDVNGDGSSEIFLGSRDVSLSYGMITCLNGTDGTKLWNYTTPMQVNSGVVLNDINGDGDLEAIFNSRDGIIRTFNAETGSLLWSYDCGGIEMYQIAVADVDQDDLAEIIVGSGDDSGNNYFRVTVLEAKPIYREAFTVKSQDGLATSNTTISSVTANPKYLRVKLSGTGVAFLNVTFPRVNTTSISVYVNRELRTPTITANATHYFIYLELHLSNPSIDMVFAPPDYQYWFSGAKPMIYAAIGIWSLALIIGVGAVFMKGGFDLSSLPIVILLGMGIFIVLFVSLAIFSGFLNL